MLVLLKILTNYIGFNYLFYYPKNVTYKIGKSDLKPYQRFQTVKAALPSKVYWLLFVITFGYSSLETTLHQRFSKLQKTPPDAGKNAGGTEFFRLGIFELLFTLYIYILGFLFYLFVEFIFSFYIIYHIINDLKFLYELAS